MVLDSLGFLSSDAKIIMRMSTKTALIVRTQSCSRTQMVFLSLLLFLSILSRSEVERCQGLEKRKERSRHAPPSVGAVYSLPPSMSSQCCFVENQPTSPMERKEIWLFPLHFYTSSWGCLQSRGECLLWTYLPHQSPLYAQSTTVGFSFFKG